MPEIPIWGIILFLIAGICLIMAALRLTFIGKFSKMLAERIELSEIENFIAAKKLRIGLSAFSILAYILMIIFLCLLKYKCISYDFTFKSFFIANYITFIILLGLLIATLFLSIISEFRLIKKLEQLV